MLGLKRGVVKVCSHQSKWDIDAKNTIKTLKTIFGDYAVDIQHIGSTAIKTISAKPIIDIAVGIKSFEYMPNILPKLKLHGMYKSDLHDISDDVLFVIGMHDDEIRTHHIHIVEYGLYKWNEYIALRDYLNKNQRIANEYEKLRLELANNYPNDRESYTEGKDKFLTKIIRKAVASSFLGKTVIVKVDRPFGSVHPKYTNIIYPINYGYIQHVLGGDKEEIDVYIMGIKKPLNEFTGKIIGIINREDDVEDKLVAAPENMIFNQQQIAEAVNFQEQYFKITINSLYRKSCGTIIYRKPGNQIEYLLLFQRKSQTWSFPKGHAEINETEQETALREVFEETGITAQLLPGFRQKVSYTINHLYQKEVVLFLAKANQDVTLKEEDITTYKWVVAEEAKEMLYPEYKQIINLTEGLVQ